MPKKRGPYKKLGPFLSELRNLTRREIIAEGSYLFNMTFEDLQELLRNKNKESVGRIALASVYAHAIAEGDYKRLQFLFDNILGRVPLAVQVNKDNTHPFSHLVENMTDKELDAALSKLEKNNDFEQKTVVTKDGVEVVG